VSLAVMAIVATVAAEMVAAAMEECLDLSQG